jgi:hypothetical protein
VVFGATHTNGRRDERIAESPSDLEPKPIPARGIDE